MIPSSAASEESPDLPENAAAAIGLRNWVVIVGRWTFVAAMGAGFITGALITPFNSYEIPGAIITFGALCIMVATARRAHLAETDAETLRNKLQDEASYHAFVDSAVEGFFRTTRDGRYLICNPALARIYGYETTEQLTQELTDIASTLYIDTSRREDFVRQTEAHGVLRDFVSQIRRRDGRVIWISENARKVTDEDDQFLFYEGTVQDITAKMEADQAVRQALQETQEAGRAKAAFLAAMSHELKTPLNAVIGFSDLMLQNTFGPVEPPRYRGYVGDIHTNGCRLLAMINDILDLSRVEGGLMVLDDTVLSVADEIKECWATIVPSAPSPLHIGFDFSERPAFLKADERRLRQILGHILSNAAKFTPKHGCIGVRVEHGEKGGIVIVVEDSGIGMSPDLIFHALQPFRQLDGSLSRKFEGAGLGLPLAHALVKLHGGHLSIESTPGIGTKVIIEFPPERTTRWTPEQSRETHAVALDQAV